MKLITKLSILLLINFVACSTEQDDRDRCDVEYDKKEACWRLEPDSRKIARDLNATAETFTGTEDQISSLRSTVRQYCESGSKYLNCLENIELIPECNPNDPITIENKKFDDKISKFLMEYACRNDGEVVLKIVANIGLKSLLDATSETVHPVRHCFKVNSNTIYRVGREGFCRHVDPLSECLLEYADKLPNQDISGVVRDIIPQLKVLSNCDDFAAKS